ncbi:esterase [Bacillus sp. FJAT-27225]|uniref:alpha/beta fold hydrolase n=1 Tax=Bacillus sp. FJAT-27225 TaxID=1743144 RepID=UPI00080C2E12|nr:alpha/beta fold hydrolase [Bacillus sp. FJAT-27225]OCA84283.1 esterase [Bacillus sp. FJAT-27225]
MIGISKEVVNSIPVLHVVDEHLQAERLPFVMFVHGFGSAKENNLHIAYLLAEKGFRVVLPEAVHHGEREQGLSQNELSIRFWDIVINTIHEVNGVKDFYVKKELADPDRIGLAGTSMGGIITLGALTKFEWVRAAVSLMGSPSYYDMANWQVSELKRLGYELPQSEEELMVQLEALKEYDLTLQPEKLAGRPLLFWHGQADTTVPHRFAWDFYKSLLAGKNGQGDVKFISEQHAGHKVTRQGTYGLVDWFSLHLGTGISQDEEQVNMGIEIVSNV